MPVQLETERLVLREPLPGREAQVELGWALAREHWGQGYATEAALAVREWIYEKRRGERLTSLISPDNPRSIRVAEKLAAWPTEDVQTPGGQATVWVHPR